MIEPQDVALQQPPEEVVLSKEQVLQDLLEWCANFQKRSADWRKNSFEPSWARWQRAADGIYDPAIAAKKQKWQSTACVPITPSHRENAQAMLFKTEVGPKPPLEVKARKGVVLMGMPDQAENIRDLILREREKSRYELERNNVLEDKTTYGSGFARVRFETKIEERKVKVPVYEPLSAFDPAGLVRAAQGQRQVIDYKDEIQEVVTYRGIVFEHISIWDVFPDPRALKIKGHPLAYRYVATYGEIVEGVQQGYYLPDAIYELENVDSEEQEPEDKRVVQADREIADSEVERTKYGRKLVCYELFAKLPKKWVFINGEPIDDPEKLIPAIVRFHEKTIISVTTNDSYDGEPEIYKDDYMPVAGQFYARGIPEMLKDVQLICNETVNQRLDTGSIALSQKFAIIEKCLVDPKDVSDGKNVWRIKSPSGVVDIKQLIMRLDMGNVPSEAFLEPQEWERWAQERTSVNRQTLGTAGQVRDANQTLGGMEMLKASAGDKFAYIGMLSEYDFQYDINRAYWKLIYANYGPEDVAMAIGPERAATFQLMTPEQVENSYQYFITGIFEMENKALRQARYAQIDTQFGLMPWFNRLELAKAELQNMDESPERFIVPEAEAIQIVQKAEEMAAGMAEQVLAEENAKEPKGGPGPNDRAS